MEIQANSRILLILDLDEVLIHSSLDNSLRNFDFLVGAYRVIKRPNLDTFLSIVSNYFDFAIWTHATNDYAVEIVDKLFSTSTLFRFIWSREKCTRRIDYEIGNDYWLKDLKKVKRMGYNLNRVLVIEDDSRMMERNYGNLITVEPFLGEIDDNCLLQLIPFLKWISEQQNVRVVEKRNWSKLKL